MGIAGDIILIIVFGLAGGLILNIIKLPPIIGYIIAGIIIGPYTGGVTVSDIPRIELLAEIGVALLLFSIGLDLSYRELKDVKGIALIGTPVQILLCIIFGYTIGHVLGLPANLSIIFGMIISLSSTMVILKILLGRGLIGTLSGKVMIGMLIVQDLAAIPLMIVIPQLHDIENNLPIIGITIIKALFVLTVIIIAGFRLIPFILKYVALLNSRELFLITITAIGLGVGYLTHLAGLSLAFGAFVAGMVISESDYSHQALSDIVPLRDVFGLIFFCSIGMLLDPRFIIENFISIIVLVMLIITGKFIVFSLISIIFRYRNIIPLALGLTLSQIGEFSFVLARTGVQSGIINKNFYSLILSVSVITMILAPFLSLLAAPIYSMKRKWFRSEPVQTINMPDGGLHNHVVITGSGRVGSQIASVLHDLNYQFIIIEQDFRRFEKSKDAGYPVIYGDATRETVLAAAYPEEAGLLIITIPSTISVREILSIVSGKNPGLHVIVRADDMENIKELRDLNISEIIQPEFEAGLEIIRQALLHLNCRITDIQNFIDDIRRNTYPSDPEKKMDSSVLAKLKDTPFLIETGWYEISTGNKLEGKTLKELEVRRKTGTSIVGLLRNGLFTPDPEPETVFHPGDMIAVIGLKEKRLLFEETFFPGK